MLEVRILRGQELFDAGLVEQIIEFDKRNMGHLRARAGMEFPAEHRCRVLEGDPTFVIAFDGSEVAGYVESLRSWRCPRYISIGSLQIDERHRRTGLILRLLDEFRTIVAEEEFEGFETSVQK